MIMMMNYNDDFKYVGLFLSVSACLFVWSLLLLLNVTAVVAAVQKLQLICRECRWSLPQKFNDFKRNTRITWHRIETWGSIIITI